MSEVYAGSECPPDLRRICFYRVLSNTIPLIGRTKTLTMTMTMGETAVWTTENIKDQLTGEPHLKKFVLV
jgi:hypothetical protein